MPNTTASGISGIDRILHGGLPTGSSIIIEGSPGTGKTTLGVQFLYNGATEWGEPGIYITFEEFPQQIYQDMLAFGWDLRELEKQNLLRVISIKPDLLLKQMKTPGGLFEQIVREIGCKRVVVDSISLLHYIYDNSVEIREALYGMRNSLRKHALTSLLIREQIHTDDKSVPFEHYVMDGVIQLAYVEQMTNYRKRTLEIKKMRGRKIVEGEHLYRITERGIYLVPALTMVEDISISSKERQSTGISELDHMLGGGIPRGSACILDTNSKANTQYLIGSILSQRILQGDKVMTVLNGISTIGDMSQLLQLYQIDLEEVCKRRDMFFIEHFLRQSPPGFEKAVYRVKDLSNDDYLAFLQKEIAPLFHEGMNKGTSWFIYYDLNTMYTQRGEAFVKRFFTEEIAWASAAGFTIFVTCNFKEVGEETASFLERAANNVIRTWVDGNYQYIQMKKSTKGTISEPRIVENISTKPFIQLV